MRAILNRGIKVLKIAVILIDLAIINMAYILAFLVRYNWTLPEYNFKSYVASAPFITIAALIYFDIFGLMKYYRKSLQEIAVTLLKTLFILSITTVTITYYLRGFSFPRLILIIAPVFQYILLLIWKGIVLEVKRLVSSDLRLMVIGERGELRAILDKVSHTLKRAKLHVHCVIPSDEIDRALKRLKDVDEVFISDNVSDEAKLSIITECLSKKKVVYIVPRMFEISLSNARIVQFEDMPAFMVDRLGLTVEQRFFKRIFDIILSFFGIILLSPVMIITAILIKLTSKGPVIYKQKRITVGNRPFDVLKFRTMYDGAEDETGPVLSDADDPRITKVGRVLRNLRIDELPQLFNVLKGEMSFVGPRPERPFFVEQFSKDIPEYTHRYLVKAGITGYAQIYGKYDTSAVDKLKYDLLYIRDYSMMLDIKLILQTIKVFRGKKAVYQDSTGKSNINIRDDSAKIRNTSISM
jgi:exopolysaccharide biosynthesis polyprenyl glycosylphosphotransferase